MADNNQENRMPPEDEETEKKETIFSIMRHFFKNYALRKTSSETQLTKQEDQHLTEGKGNNRTDNEATASCSRINTSNRAPINTNTRNVLTENSINTRRGKATDWNLHGSIISEFTEPSASAKHDRKSLSPRNEEIREHYRNSRNSTVNKNKKTPSPKKDVFQERISSSKNLNAKCSRKSPKGSDFQKYCGNSENLSPVDHRNGTDSPIVRGHVISTRDLQAFSGDSALRCPAAKSKNQTLSFSKIPKGELKPERATSGREVDRDLRSDFIRSIGERRNEVDSICESLRPLSTSREVSEQRLLETCKPQPDCGGAGFVRNREDIVHCPSSDLFQRNISISPGDIRLESVNSDDRLLHYIKCNLRKLTKLNLQSGGVIFLNSEGLNISFAKLKPDMNHIVNQTETSISVLNVPLMSGGTVILKEAAEGFAVPDYYTKNTPYVVQPVCGCSRCKKLGRPLTSSSESGDEIKPTKKKIPRKGAPTPAPAASHSGGCMVETIFTTALPELFPSSNVLPLEPQAASSSACSLSGGRHVDLTKEDDMFLSLFHQARGESIAVEMQGHGEEVAICRQMEAEHPVGGSKGDDQIDQNEMEDLNLIYLIDDSLKESP